MSCEACHGPAGKWLQAHVEDGATHAKNLDAGLYDTADPVSRAKFEKPTMCSSSRGNWPRIRLSSAMATFFAGFHRSFCSMLQLMSSISTVAVRVVCSER